MSMSADGGGPLQESERAEIEARWVTPQHGMTAMAFAVAASSPITAYALVNIAKADITTLLRALAKAEARAENLGNVAANAEHNTAAWQAQCEAAEGDLQTAKRTFVAVLAQSEAALAAAGAARDAARREALEEAAKVCADIAYGHEMKGLIRKSPEFQAYYEDRCAGATECAQAVRALSPRPAGPETTPALPLRPPT